MVCEVLVDLVCDSLALVLFPFLLFLREMLDPPVPPEPRVLPDCRECPVSVVLLAFQD